MESIVTNLVDLFWEHVKECHWEIGYGTLLLIKMHSVDTYIKTYCPLIKRTSENKRYVPQSLFSWLALVRGDKLCTTTKLVDENEMKVEMLLEVLVQTLPENIHQELSDLYLKKNEDAFVSEILCNYLHELCIQDPEKFEGLAVVVNHKVFTQAYQNNIINFMKMEEFANIFKIISKVKVSIGDGEYKSSLLSLLKLKLDNDHLWKALLSSKNVEMLKLLDELKQENLVCKIVDSPWRSVDEALRTKCGWLNLFLLCFTNRLHPLQCVLENCLQLIKTGNYEDSVTLLSSLAPVKSLMLLVSWTQQSTFDDAITFLHTFYDKNEVLLSEATKKLVYQTDLLKWCIEQIRDIMGSDMDSSVELNSLFCRLESSSILFMLNETKLLQTMQYEHVVNLLEKQPCQEFQLEINKYISFSLIKQYLDLLAACTNGNFTNGVAYSKHLLMEKLKNINIESKNIVLLEMRVELLENIFSLIFLRTADLKSTEDIDMENIEEVTVDTGLSASLESISTNSLPSPQNHQTSNDVEQLENFFGIESFEEFLTETSSSTTLKLSQAKDDLVKAHAFLINKDLLVLTLEMLHEHLQNISTDDKKLRDRLLRLNQYVSEAQWRCEVITGFDTSILYEHMQPNLHYKKHIVGRLLSSGSSLVYLAMKKSDFYQSKQVVDIFKLQGKECFNELDFTERFFETSEQLRNISGEQDSVLGLNSPEDMVRQAAATGKTLALTIQLFDTLVAHDFVAQQSCVKSFYLAVAVDLLFHSPLPINIASRLLELVQQRCLDGNIGSCNELTQMMSKISWLQSLLNSSTQLDFVHVFGQQKPTCLTHFLQYIPSYLDCDQISVLNHTVVLGETLFADLESHVVNLRAVYTQLQQIDSSTPSLKSKVYDFLVNFSCDVLVQLNSTTDGFDYFRSLFKYVENLATLRLYYKNRLTSDADISIKAANPFVVLQSDTTTTFGSLLFQWGMLPRKLEAFAKPSNVNLVKVIASYCNFKISTKPHTLLLKDSIFFADCVVLNEKVGVNDITESLAEKVRSSNPNVVVEDVLRSVIEMISEGGHFKSSLILSEVCQWVTVSTQDLHNIDLSSLTSGVEQRALLVNLYNLAMLHAILQLLSGKFFHDQPVSPQQISAMLSNFSSRLAFMQCVEYRVGDCSISVFDMYSALVFGKAKENTPQNFEGDSKIIVLLYDGTVDSPEIQVVTSEDFELFLNDSSSNVEESYKFKNKANVLELGQEKLELYEKLSQLVTTINVSVTTKVTTKEIIGDTWQLQPLLQHLFCKPPTDFVNMDSQLKLSSFSDSITEYFSISSPLTYALMNFYLQTQSVFSKSSSETFELKLKLEQLIKCTFNFDSIDKFLKKPIEDAVSILNGIESCDPDLTDNNTVYESVKDYLLAIDLCVSKKSHSLLIKTLLDFYLKRSAFHILLSSNMDVLNHVSPDFIKLLLRKSIYEVKTLIGELKFKKLKIDDYFVKLNSKQRCLKHLLLLIADRVMQCELTLECVECLSASDSKQLLRLCMNCGCDTTLQRKYEEIDWYEKVNIAAKTSSFDSWWDVKELVETSPEKVQSFLTSVKQFPLLSHWIVLFGMPQEHFQDYYKEKLKHMIGGETLDDVAFLSIIDNIKSEQMCLDICQDVIKECKTYSKCLLNVIEYMKKSGLVLPPVKQQFIEHGVGILCVELVPVEYRSSYKHLQTSPLLIFEQLLVNSKISDAANVADTIRRECTSLIAPCDDLVAKYAAFSLDAKQIDNEFILISQGGSPSVPGTPRVSTPVKEIRAGDLRERITSISSYSKDRTPLQAVEKSLWVKDNLVTSCMLCEDNFHMFNRRHHCRHCGKVVCANCSKYFCHIPRYKRKERTCDVCYNAHYAVRPESPSSTAGPVTSLSRITFDHTQLQHPGWLFSLNPTENQAMLEDFAYEQAPSAPLCLSITDLHSNETTASGLLLKFCNDLSYYYQHKADEYDLNMVTGMIEFILNHAKLKLSKVGDYNGVSLCDSHLSRVEILKILLAANWKHIPTMQDLANRKALRQLRDRLICNESYSLALELTNKAGLDVMPVCFVIGLSSLKCKHLSKAREYFSRCLTPTQGDSIKAFAPNANYLGRIIASIEKAPWIIYNTETKTGSELDKARYEEIMYYLRTYGCYGTMLTFFLRHQLYREAVLFLKEKKCPYELFSTHVLIPCFQEGQFEKLHEELRLSDPTMRSWEAHFNEACKQLSKHGHYHCLYQLQLVLKDYFRAALTCVRFYLGTSGHSAVTYTQLMARTHYLRLANKHLETVLKDRSSSFVSHIGSTFLGEDKLGAKEISISELKRHLCTVSLQIEVTQFLSEHEQIAAPKLPTLFGPGKERAEVAMKILIISSEKGIALASRIIQEFKLPSVSIFGRAVVKLAKQQKHEQALSLVSSIEQTLKSSEKDEILLQVVNILAQSGEVKNSEKYLEKIREDIPKISALIACGHLREAYLAAVRKERVAQIDIILRTAQSMPSQKGMVAICEKWLNNYNKKQNMK